MKYQPQHDVIDPDYPIPDEDVVESTADPKAADGAWVIGGNQDSGQVLVTSEDGKPKSRSRRGTRAWVMPAAFVLTALFVGLTVWNLSHLVSGAQGPPKPSPFQVKQALYLGVMRVDAYRRVHGVTPDTLLDVGLSDTAGYSYVRIDSTRYVLSFRVDGPKLEYDSNEEKGKVFGKPGQMLTLGGTK